MIDVGLHDLKRNVIYRPPSGGAAEFGTITGFDATAVFVRLVDEVTRKVTHRTVSRTDLEFGRDPYGPVFRHLMPRRTRVEP